MHAKLATRNLKLSRHHAWTATRKPRERRFMWSRTEASLLAMRDTIESGGRILPLYDDEAEIERDPRGYEDAAADRDAADYGRTRYA